MESDESLVTRTLRGELSAFETLVERHRAAVEQVATRVVGRQEAEDVAQDSLLRAFHTLQSFRGEASFRTWLLRVTRNTALNALARRRPQVTRAEERPGDGAPVASPARELEEHERQERLRAKISALRPPHRSVLVLSDLEGLSYREIADLTDVPLGTVKGRLSRARLELIAMLRDNTYDWELPG